MTVTQVAHHSSQLNFEVIPSDLPGMDFVTVFMISEHQVSRPTSWITQTRGLKHGQVHFSLRSTNLVIRARHKDAQDIFELIPQAQLEGDLPAILTKGYAHWLNLSTHTIEIRPLKKLWERSFDNWRIDHASRPYRMTKGCESLVDIRSPTWDMVSRRLECLENKKNLIITSSPVDSGQCFASLRLSVSLPRYGLSFFVNDGGDLESCDFKDMVYDEDQCVGTLFGLVNRLVLRPKVQVEEDLFPRCILVPVGKHHLTQHGHHRRVVIRPHKSSANVPRRTKDPNQPDNVLYHIYKVDGTLGCLTGISSLTSRRYLANLHAITNNACRPDPLTGRTGVEEAISLAWLAGTRLLLESGEKVHDVGFSSSWNQMVIAAKQITEGPYFDAELKYRRNAVLQEAYLYPSEIQLPKEERDHVPLHKPSLSDNLVFTAASIVNRWSLDSPIINDLSSWVKAWGDTILGEGPSSQLGALRSNSTVPPLIYILQGGGRNKADGASRRFHLLFSLPVLVYSSENRETTLLSMLVELSNQPHINLENRPHYAEYNLLDGYHPEHHRVRDCVSKACHSRRVVEIDAALEQLLRSWPSETAPVHLLDPDRFDIASLNASLQPLFSSWYRNLRLKEYLTPICGEPTSLPPNSATYTLPSPDWQVTLDKLLRERPAPELPHCDRLPGKHAGFNGVSSADISRLGQLFSSLATGERVLEFQTQYVARLQSSAHHIRVQGTYASILDAVKPSMKTLQEHYAQCRASYANSLNIVKKALGPRTQIEQIVERCGKWPRTTPYTLFRCLATTSPIKPPESWKKCLISLVLLALELQRARRLLQFALENLEEEFFKELENEGGDGWLASEHPDWLLIQVSIRCPGSSCLPKLIIVQLQGNFLIRRSQVDVAKEMMAPQSKSNTMMQVNMGEGKSSVIIPICAAALANSCQLVRVIVPKALKTQMLQLLANRLGGLVGMSIYGWTLSRFGSYPGSADWIRKITNERGIIVMTPEDVLALKLTCVDEMVHDKIKADSSSTVRKLDYEHLLSGGWLKSVSMLTTLIW